MSTYLDFRCKTCDVNCNLSSHRCGIDNEMFLKLLEKRAHLAALADVGTSISGYGLFREDLDLVPHFFAAHAGHEVVLANGYGQEWNSDRLIWSASRFD